VPHGAAHRPSHDSLDTSFVIRALLQGASEGAVMRCL
jgi:hypothetical protein